MALGTSELDLDKSLHKQKRTALIVAELNRYDIDITSLSEVRYVEDGSLEEVEKQYTFF